MPKRLIVLLLFAGAGAFLIYAQISDYTDFFLKVKENIASIFFVDSSSEKILRERYVRARETGKKIKILIVPGHDDIQGGAEFRGVREAELNMNVGKELQRVLSKNPFFDVSLSRTREGYNPLIETFLQEKKKEIQDFASRQRSLMKEYIAARAIEPNTQGVEHNTAPSRMIHILYGINKWANDNEFDIVLHIHFNDNPRKRIQDPGTYSGFTIYVPEKQYSNAKGSRALAESIYPRLSRFYPTSNLPKEKTGIVEDQDLIAIGSNNSVDAAALLIEYSYIYEPILQDAKLREAAISDMALQTYLGIMDFFKDNTSKEGGPFETRILPHQWNNDMARGNQKNKDILALQTALTIEKVYPPLGFSKNQCSLSGNFGPCTKTAVEDFQKKYGIPASGIMETQTRNKLNELYGN